MLRESDLSSKLAQVIEQIPKDVLYDFCCSYAQELPFRKGTKGFVHFFGAKKRNQRNIHPLQGLDRWSTSVATRDSRSKLHSLLAAPSVPL